MRFPLIAWVLSLCVASSAFAGFFPSAELIVIDRGVPTDGTIEMTGYRGYTLRVVTDQPITRVIAGAGATGIGTGAIGGLAQRWEDPTGTGTFVSDLTLPPPTLTSPGLLPYDNTTPSAFNFDSHWLLDPDVTYDVLDIFEYGEFDTSINPIPGTPFVGYGTVPIPFPFIDPIVVGGGQMSADYFITTPDVYELDLAYVVTNSAFLFEAAIQTTSGFGVVVQQLIMIPEPTAPALVAIFAATLAPRRRERKGT